MALANHLRRRGGTYSGRISVPADLVERIGKREIQEALGKVRDPADAKRKVAVWAQGKRAWFDRLRGGAKLTSEMIERECQEIARAFLEFLKADRLGRLQQPKPPFDGEDDPDPRQVGLEQSMDRFADAIEEGRFAPVADEAAQIVLRLGVSAVPDSPEWNELCRALLHTHAEVYRVELDRHCGQADAVARLPLNAALAGTFSGEAAYRIPLSQPKASATALVGEWRLGQAIDQYLATRDRARAWTAKTAHQHGSSLKMFREFAGDETPLPGIARRQLGDFKALLERLPVTYGKLAADKGRTLEAIAAEGDGADIERLGTRTIQRHLTALSGLFGWAKEHGRYDGDNPARGFSYPRTKRPRDERPSWSAVELEALFRSPMWTGCVSPPQRHRPGTHVIRDHRYFLPLLGAYAGLRLEEGCQLRVEDVATEDDIPFINIRTGEGRQLKNKAAVRRVPLHPVLIDAGFQRHVEEAKRRGDRLLFAALRPGGPDKRLGFYETKRFTDYRRRIGTYEKGRDFHALRHSFTTALAAADVSRAVIDELTGHEGTGETSRYTKALPLTQLRDAVGRVSYGFDTSHLRFSPQS